MSHRLSLLLGIAILPTIVGCSSDSTSAAIAAMNDTNIKKVTNLYTGFMSRNSWKGPKDEATFKAFIRGYDPDRIKAMQIPIEDLDKIFVSERDGQPFQIRYSQSGGPGAAIAITFEKEGKDGTRQVGMTNGTVEDVDSTKYQELWTGRSDSKESRPTPAPSNPGKGGRPTRAPAGAPTGPPQG